MNWAWATSLDQVWRAPAFPMWVTLVAALAFSLVLLVTLFRAEKSVANGALTVITLLAIGIAVAATARGFGTTGAGTASDNRGTLQASSLPALSCLDGLAGDVVETACERALFASAESSAAAVSYTAGQITRLASFGDEAAANKVMTPELSSLRRAVERDRYGLVAHVLTVRDGCTPSDCAFYNSLSDHNQIAAGMTDHTYEGLITRYAPTWNAPAAAGPALAGMSPSVPAGKPLSGDFPSAASIPPVSIMAPEPGPKPAPPPAAAPRATPASTAVNAPAAAPRAAAAPKKPPVKKNAAAPAAAPAAATTDPLAPSARRDDN